MPVFTRFRRYEACIRDRCVAPRCFSPVLPAPTPRRKTAGKNAGKRLRSHARAERSSHKKAVCVKLVNFTRTGKIIIQNTPVLYKTQF